MRIHGAINPTIMADLVNIDIRDAVKKLQSELGYASKDKRDLAVARAINHTLARVKTQASKEIRSLYNLDAKTVNAALTIEKADRLKKYGKVRSKGKTISLEKFGARQTKKGVTVMIRKDKGRKLIPGVFLASMNSGHTGVMFRGTYNGQKMVRRKNRIRKTGNDLGISEMKGVSIPAAFSNNAIIKSLQKDANTMFTKRLAHELKRVSMPW